jgi:hypothetical protein
MLNILPKDLENIIIDYKKQLETLPLLKEYKNDWFAVSKSGKLTEDEMEFHKKELCWFDICIYQQLSEKFIREHQDVMVWGNIAKYQDLSYDFIYEFKHKLKGKVFDNYVISIELKKQLNEKIFNGRYTRYVYNKYFDEGTDDEWI